MNIVLNYLLILFQMPLCLILLNLKLCLLVLLYVYDGFPVDTYNLHTKFYDLIHNIKLTLYYVLSNVELIYYVKSIIYFRWVIRCFYGSYFLMLRFFILMVNLLFIFIYSGCMILFLSQIFSYCGYYYLFLGLLVHI